MPVENRRKFLRAAMAGGLAVAAGMTLQQLGPVADAKARMGEHAEPSQARDWVMVIDLARCDGCKECTAACIEEHFVAPAWGEPNYKGYQEWIKVYEMESSYMKHFLPRPCMNCDNAPCVKVCPVGASYKRDDGLVLIDQDRCIGCRFCIAACPYGARFINPKTETADKCTLCYHRITKGLLPACVQACPKYSTSARCRHWAFTQYRYMWESMRSLVSRSPVSFFVMIPRQSP